MRENIYEILSERGFSVDQEYGRLYQLFHESNTLRTFAQSYSVCEFIEAHFRRFDKRFIRRCLSFQDFNRTYGFSFPALSPSFHNLPLDVLIRYMEYLYNLLFQVQIVCSNFSNRYLLTGNEQIRLMASNIESLLDETGYTKVAKECIFIFVNTTPEIEAVTESLEESLAIKVFEYNHHRFKGNLDAKLGVLKYLADNIEPSRKELDKINPGLTSNLFQMFHKFVRHNNDDNPIIANMSDKETEKWYDEIYQMWLLAKLILKNQPRSKEVKNLLGRINAGQG